ncbi:hypothetical protein V5T82_17660 [Magnetovibrio sp. PR-2]|uniref:hypothetical protein n=1 Tax=Magnetovibrio sp. PR-2 TaxID=3120356 RepID=UPI002FCE01C8
MADKIEQRLADTNAVLMGHGVGVAALEAMFNLVNSQSVLSATMIRDHELSHPIQMQALAQALSQLLACSDAMGCKSRSPINIPTSAVAVDIPPAQPTAQPTTQPPVQPAGQSSVDLGAVSDLSALDGIKKGAGADGQQSSINLDSVASQHGLDGEMIQQLLIQFMSMASKHMADVIESSRPHLEVT